MSDSEKAWTELMTPGPRQERAEDGQRERRDRQGEVPDPHQAAPLLHERRVEVGGPAEPGQQGRVLDRVPPPEAAPTEHLVRPPGTEHDADGQEREGHQGPSPALDLPAVTHPAGGQHADGKGEGHGEDHESDVEERRVDHHERVVLKQRVRPDPLRRSRCGHEGVGRPDHQAEEERRDDVEDERGVADDRVVGDLPVAPDEDARHDGEDEAPQEDRPGERGPHPGDRVQQRRHGAVVLGHEHQREVVRDEGVLHGARREEGAHEHHRCEQSTVGCGPIGGGELCAGSAGADVDGGEPPVGDEADDAHDDPGEAGQEGEPDTDRPQIGVQHQQAGPVAVTFTRFGYSAVYVLECLMRMEFETNSGEASDLKWPTTTTGTRDAKSEGGLPVLATWITCGPWQTAKFEPAAVEWMVPGTTVPSRRKVWVPSECLLARA